MISPDVISSEATSPELGEELPAPSRGRMRLGCRIGAALFVLTVLLTPNLLKDPGEELDPTQAGRVLKVTLDQGETLDSTLGRFGVDEATAHAIIEAFGPLISPREIRMGHSLQIFFDGQGNRVTGVEYPLSTVVLKAVAKPEGWSAERKEIISTRGTRVVRGVLSRNLYQDGTAAGLTPAQVMELADIFQYDVDFFSDIQRGDLFSVAFEEIRYQSGRREPKRILAAELTVGGRRLHAFHYTNQAGEGGYYDIDGHSLRRAFLRAPLNYRSISSRYTLRRQHPILRIAQPHQAIDYAAAAGTPVVSIGRGTVKYAGWKDGYGNLVEVLHPNGYTTRYGHFSRIAAGIRKGIRIDQGRVIGYVGQTGHATGPHLHFEILRDQTKINFLSLRIPSQRQLAGEEMDFFTNLRDERLTVLHDKEVQLARSLP